MANRSDKMCQNPPVLPDLDDETLLNTSFYKSRHPMANIQTPTVSEEQVMEPGEIVSPALQKRKETVIMKCFEMNDFITKEKCRKICVQKTATKDKKKREHKSDKEKIEQCKKRTKSDTVSAKKEYYDSSSEESLRASRSKGKSYRSPSPRYRSPGCSHLQRSRSPVPFWPHKRRSPSQSSSSLHWSPRRSSRDSSPRRRNHARSLSSSDEDRSCRRRSIRRSSSRTPSDRRRSLYGSSTRPKYRNRPQSRCSKRDVTLRPNRIRVRESPIRKKSFVHSHYGGKSKGSSRSPDEGRPIKLEKERIDESRKTLAANPNGRLVYTSKFNKLPVKNELAEEMRKRQLLIDSLKQKTAAVKMEVKIKKETDCAEENKNNLVNSSEMQPDSVSETKFVKPEFPEQKPILPNCYYCQTCQLGLNSDVTWQSHITGKKHAKMLKLQTIHEVAKGTIAIPSTPAVVSEDIPRFSEAAPGKKRTPTNETSRLLPAIRDIKDRPLIGLNFIQEIVSPSQVNYYCQLCDAPCGPSSILPHLFGYKHQLSCLKQIDPVCYERNRDRSKKSFESELISRLFKHEKRFGRGVIKVFKEEDDPMTRPIYDLPGLSWRNTSAFPDIKKEIKEEQNTEIPINDAYLDTSKGDFFCKLCDSHMNNVDMWEAHVKGKRHLQNAQKIPGEDNISKLRSVRLPDVRSKLEEDIDKTEHDKLCVGLGFIRETRDLNGPMYNCFLCASCCTSRDIIEHILLPKHRLRYLEKLDTEGKSNNVTTIRHMQFQDPLFREMLVDDECRKMLEKYGRGEVEVYQVKY